MPHAPPLSEWVARVFTYLQLTAMTKSTSVSRPFSNSRGTSSTTTRSSLSAHLTRKSTCERLGRSCEGRRIAGVPSEKEGECTEKRKKGESET